MAHIWKQLDNLRRTFTNDSDVVCTIYLNRGRPREFPVVVQPGQTVKIRKKRKYGDRKAYTRKVKRFEGY